MDEYDAFSAGVEYGGLRSQQDIKLLICFLLDSLERPLTKTQLNEVMQDQGLANYFEVNQALSDLVATGIVNKDLQEEQEVLSFTERGRDAIALLADELPRTVREKALNAAVRLQIQARHKRENTIEVETLENGYHVTFTILDKQDVLMRLTVYVADITQVETVKKAFLNDPVSLYSGIIAALTA